MRVQLLHFALFREAVGRDREARELPSGTRVRDLWTRLVTEVPRLGMFPAMPPAAVNREYVDGSRILAEGDEVVFLPPVAGG